MCCVITMLHTVRHNCKTREGAGKNQWSGSGRRSGTSQLITGHMNILRDIRMEIEQTICISFLCLGVSLSAPRFQSHLVKCRGTLGTANAAGTWTGHVGSPDQGCATRSLGILFLLCHFPSPVCHCVSIDLQLQVRSWEARMLL